MESKLVIEPRDGGFAIVKYQTIIRTHRTFVALFETQPDGSLIRTLSCHGIKNLMFPDLESVKEWYGIK